MMRDMERREGGYRLRMAVDSYFGLDVRRADLIRVRIAWTEDNAENVNLLKSYGVGKTPDDLRILVGGRNGPFYTPLDYREVPEGLKEISGWLTQAGIR